MLSHSRGAKHLKKARAIESTGLLVDQQIIPIQNPGPTRTKVPTKLIDKIREDRSNPVVGLGFIKEFIPVSNSEMEPHYECALCESQGQANCMFSHLLGRKHRKNFLDSLRYGGGLDTSELSPAQLREGAMLYDEKNTDLVSRITTIYSDSSYPWPCGKEPWNELNGGTGIAPDDARSNFGNQQQFKSEETLSGEKLSSSGLYQGREEKSKCIGWKVSGPRPSYGKGEMFQRPSPGEMLPNLVSQSFTTPLSSKPFLNSTSNEQRCQSIQDARSMLESGRKMLLSVAEFRGSGISCHEKRLLSNCLMSVFLKVGTAIEKSNSRSLPTETSTSKLSLAAPVGDYQMRPNTNKPSPSPVPREGLSCELRGKDSNLSEILERRSRSRPSITHGRIRSRSPRLERTRSPSTAISSTSSTRSSSTLNSETKSNSYWDGWSRRRRYTDNKRESEASCTSRSRIHRIKRSRNKDKERDLERRERYIRDERR